MKIMDERMAAAAGPRGHRHNIQRNSSPKTLQDEEVTMQIKPSTGENVGGNDSGGKWRLTFPSSSSSVFVGPLCCAIILFVIALSVFGLEIYRIREINDLAQRTEILERDMDVLRRRTSQQPNFNYKEISKDDESDLVRIQEIEKKEEEFEEGFSNKRSKVNLKRRKREDYFNGRQQRSITFPNDKTTEDNRRQSFTRI